MVKTRQSLVITFFLLVILTGSGCYVIEPEPGIVGCEPDPLPAGIVSRFQSVGRSVQGRQMMIEVLGDGTDVTLVMASIHGNEPAGTPLVHALSDYLKANLDFLDGRTVVIMPVANPDGLARGTRYNVHNVDLNRNFTASNRQNNAVNGLAALSEPESRAIHHCIRDYQPDRIISLHQPLACVDYDGPARSMALRMSRLCALPIKKLGARPGSLGSYAGEILDIPIITLEMRRTDSSLSAEQLWQQYGQALLAGIGG